MSNNDGQFIRPQMSQTFLPSGRNPDEQLYADENARSQSIAPQSKQAGKLCDGEQTKFSGLIWFIFEFFTKIKNF